MSEQLVERSTHEAVEPLEVHSWLSSSDGDATCPEALPEVTIQRLAKLYEEIPYVGSLTELMEQLKRSEEHTSELQSH